MENIDLDNVQRLLAVLSVVGGVVIAIPAVLRALEAVFKLIPGENPDKALEKVRIVSEKIAEVVAKLLPKLPGK